VPFLGAYAYKKHTPTDFPVAFEHSNRMVSLPLYPELEPKQQQRVLAALAAALGRPD
jgi:dTDP-4-amino-4,6-dideoxygalactose transaminase